VTGGKVKFSKLTRFAISQLVSAGFEIGDVVCLRHIEVVTKCGRVIRIHKGSNAHRDAEKYVERNIQKLIRERDAAAEPHATEEAPVEQGEDSQ
jgi:hypothetical protein